MWVFTVLAQDYSLAFLFLSGVFFVTSARKTGREEYLYDTEKSAWKQDGLMNENDDKEWIHQHRKTHADTISTLETQIWKTHKRAHSANVHRISSKRGHGERQGLRSPCRRRSRMLWAYANAEFQHTVQVQCPNEHYKSDREVILVSSYACR